MAPRVSARLHWAVVLLAFAGMGCGGGDSEGEGGGRTPDGETALPSEGGDEAGAAATPGEIPGGRVETRTPPATPSTGGSGAAGGAADPDTCSAVSKTAEVELGPVDIVWVIDGSLSMVDETQAVQQNITTFANQISAAGIDHHVVMVANADVAAPTPLGADAAHYRYVLANVDSWNSLQVLLDTYPLYSDFLRPEAALHFVVVTDDNSGIPATAFQPQMEMLAGKSFLFHSIASEDAPGPCLGACGLPLVCGAFSPGFEYYALSDMTGGERISICVADWSQVFGPLQEAVIASAPLPCSYPIPEPPSGETLDADKVNMEFTATDASAASVLPRAENEGGCADAAAWFYDDPGAPSELVLCPSACSMAQLGGTIDIAFGCATVPLVLE